ncbi:MULTISPECIES: TetR/AcrR family transcriptional regulator [Microbacterium]|uniref:TetR/AcrR family transcriptional regulator n=1 Tax=Microbacterium TaxID=33882 RepID=UPI0011EB43E3|nr:MULTISPECIES: TetR/AcrR family transcriptional regulator [Microbacterium]
MSIPVPELPLLTPGARRVLDAASDLFYERGIHAIGVDTIAAAAGVTKKTLYDRFGSKEALVVSYLQHRDARWRDHVAAHLARVPEPGPVRVLAIFDAAIAWVPDNSAKGCSAINARAEIDGAGDAPLVLAEARREKEWLLAVFAELCSEAGFHDPHRLAETLMLLYEGAIVTVGMGTFAEPFATARESARRLLDSAPTGVS